MFLEMMENSLWNKMIHLMVNFPRGMYNMPASKSVFLFNYLNCLIYTFTQNNSQGVQEAQVSVQRNIIRDIKQQPIQ